MVLAGGERYEGGGLRTGVLTVPWESPTLDLVIVIPTSQLLIKTRIKFYNGSHLWFNTNRILQRKMDNSNERKKVLGNYPISKARPGLRFILIERQQPFQPPTRGEL